MRLSVDDQAAYAVLAQKAFALDTAIQWFVLERPATGRSILGSKYWWSKFLESLQGEARAPLSATLPTAKDLSDGSREWATPVERIGEN
jgi:hypothetical protein